MARLGVERMSKSQVWRFAQSLDGIVEDFRTRPSDGVSYAYVTLAALGVKCLQAHNDDPKPFVRTASVDTILEMVGRCAAALETVR